MTELCVVLSHYLWCYFMLLFMVRLRGCNVEVDVSVPDHCPYMILFIRINVFYYIRFYSILLLNSIKMHVVLPLDSNKMHVTTKRKGYKLIARKILTKHSI